MTELPPAVEMFDKMAQLYEAKYMNVDTYKDSLDTFCEQLPSKDADILELGCGPGNLTKYLLDRNPKFRILATDLAPNMLKRARLNCPTATFKIMDCRQAASLSKKFDAVVAGFCLPYLAKNEVLDLIQSVRDVLNPQGLFYLSTMQGDYNESRMQKSSSGDEVFVHYYDRKFVSEVLSKANFEIIDTWIQPDLTQKVDAMDLVILAKKV